MQPAPTTLPQLLDETVEAHAEAEAIVAGQQRLTYADLQERVDRFARGLLAAGVTSGDRVGVLVPNRPAWYVATFAVERIGATMVALNTWHKRDELAYALESTDVSMLVTVDSFLGNDYVERLAPLVQGSARTSGSEEGSLPFLESCIVRGDTPEWAVSWTDLLECGQSVPASRLERATEAVQPTDDAYVLFSSGTTDRPKPIVLKHDGLATNPRCIGERLDVNASSRFWMPLPLFFSFAACNGSLTALAHGATLVLQERFDAVEARDLIATEQCTVLYGMGNMFKQLEDLPNVENAFDAARVALLIGPKPLRRRVETVQGVDAVVHAYGLTEVGAICTLTRHDEPHEARLDTVGRPLANVDVRIKDPDGSGEVPPGDQGEIAVRSRAMFDRYEGMPERTREAFDRDGYLRTGDIGRLNPEGRLVFKGRMTDMIKTGGINVSPQEVQNALESHPDVEAAAVFAVEDEQLSEAVAAAVQPIADADLSAADVRAHCESRISSYKVPETVHVRDEPFPRTDTGKIRTDELQREYRGGGSQSSSS